jgi:hypothetical protein
MKCAWVLVMVGCGRSGFEPVTSRDASDVNTSDAQTDAAPDAVAFDPTMCPASYTVTIPSTNTRYRYASSFLDWPDANADCVNDLNASIAFTHLAVFSTQQEHDEIAALFEGFSVGFSDRVTEGTMLAVTLEPLGNYLMLGGPAWFPGEPNNQGGVESCVHMKLEDGLNDADCTIVRDHLCECDGYADTPSQY